MSTIENKGLNTIEKENTSIRIKVTEKCPWDCTFCHKEGGWNIDDIRWDKSTMNAIELLKDKLKLTEAHYTGGEPTSNKYLEELNVGLTSLGLEVKTTSNAQFSEERLEALINSGLKSFNFSVHGLTPEEFSKTQRNKNSRWAKENVKTQMRIISKVAELGLKTKINTVVSCLDDIEKSLEIYDFSKENGISVRFLNDLGNGEEAIDAILELVENKIGAKKFKETVVKGSSSKTSYYRDSDGYEFGIKEIRENKIRSLCENCKENCTEQFYGIRLEKKNGRFFVRLCIDRHDGKSYMPLEEFIESDQLKEILEIIN